MTWDYTERMKVIDALQGLEKNGKQSLATQEKIADAFTRMASAVEKLTKEVAALREDMNPALDKPKKFPAPGAAGG